MNWQDIFRSDTRIGEPEKLIATYAFHPKNCGFQRILINIWEDASGKYTALTDHSIKNRVQADSYREMDSYDTPEKALEAAIFGITQYITEPYDEIKFIKEEQF